MKDEFSRIAEIGRRRPGDVEDGAVHPDAGEAAPREVGPQLRGRQAGGDREAERDHRARAGVRFEQRVHDRLGRVRDGRRAAGGGAAPAEMPLENSAADSSREVAAEPTMGPEELIREASAHALGLRFLEKAPPETVAVTFGVHPFVVFRARGLLENPQAQA